MMIFLGGYLLIWIIALLFIFIVVIPFIKWYRKKQLRSQQHFYKLGFQPTDEIFIDPTTGIKQRVWFNPSTGERKYEIVNDPDLKK
jgi:hypothetical protein